MGVPLRRRLYRLRHRHRSAIVLPVLAALLLFLLFWRAVSVYLRPAVETLAVSEAENRVSRTVAQAVARCVEERNLTYGDFITMETDESGRVTSLTGSLSAVSLLRSELVDYIGGELDGLREESFGLPLGTLTGWLIFSGRGPTVRVELLSAGDVTVQMRHGFEEAGINQTLHQVLLDVSVKVLLLLPGETLSTQVDSEVCVAETVIVGQVPDTYLYMGNGETDTFS